MVDPKKLSDGERKRLTWFYVDRIFADIGLEVAISVPDVSTDLRIMSCFMT